MKKNKSLTVGWLYPLLMSTYGDRGNIMSLKKIGTDNDIDINILPLEKNTDANELEMCDLLFMGGAQDLQQEIVSNDLITKKGRRLVSMIEDNVPGLFICGAYQFLGKYYRDARGNKIRGLGVFEMYTEAKENDRLIGNTVIRPTSISSKLKANSYFVGFENHGGRTFLDNRNHSFAEVIVGNGNNGEDKTEGIHYKNTIGTYLHGPILPSNPELCIVLLKIAYQKKYKEDIELKFHDKFAEKAKLMMLKRLKTSY